jgi:hypothetical protein
MIIETDPKQNAWLHVKAGASYTQFYVSGGELTAFIAILGRSLATNSESTTSHCNIQ